MSLRKKSVCAECFEHRNRQCGSSCFNLLKFYNSISNQHLSNTRLLTFRTERHYLQGLSLPSRSSISYCAKCFHCDHISIVKGDNVSMFIIYFNCGKDKYLKKFNFDPCIAQIIFPSKLPRT